MRHLCLLFGAVVACGDKDSSGADSAQDSTGGAGGNVESCPALGVSTSQLDFGDVAAGAFRSESLILSNDCSGTEDLVVIDHSLDSVEFYLTSSFPLEVAPGSSAELEVSFVPASDAPTNAVLTLHTNDEDASISLVAN